MIPHRAMNHSETTTSSVTAFKDIQLPPNRFELELEFIQALASPNYLHFLATCGSEYADGTILQDPHFLDFLRYLRDTWTKPEYSRFITYPHCLYFLELLIEQPAIFAKEWTLPAYRNFCHQQQFLSWQHRHAVCYGRGGNEATAGGGGGDTVPETTASGTGSHGVGDANAKM